jgi:hypothetical protein
MVLLGAAELTAIIGERPHIAVTMQVAVLFCWSDP